MENLHNRSGMPRLIGNEPPDLRRAITERYTSIAENALQTCTDSGNPVSSDPVSASGLSRPSDAKTLYTSEEIHSVPGAVVAASSGCGNPTAIAQLNPGETVLDLGSGGGMDCFLAAREVGLTGTVIGVDMTPAMINLAQKNAAILEAHNVAFKLSHVESIPEPDDTIDVIISNCVINLVPNKRAVFTEAFRVLSDGGRLCVSDIVVTRELPLRIQTDLASWTGCIAGALLQDAFIEEMVEVGFQDIEIVSSVPAQTLTQETWTDALRSLSVKALKRA